MTNDNIEEQLGRLGRDWPTEESFVGGVMSRLDAAPRRPPTSNPARRRLMRLSYWTAATIVVSAGLWWAFGPQSTGSALYAQMKEALKQVQTIHAVVSRQTDDGQLHPAIETWFARRQGFVVDGPEYVRIDDGTYFWEHRKGSDVASRSKSQGTDELLDQALNIRAELEQTCERHPAGDRQIDGVDHECYWMTFPGAVKPADPAILDLDRRRTFIFIDPRSLPTLVESQEKIEGNWQTRFIRTFEYDVPVDPKVFEPDFGELVRMIDTDEAFEQLTSMENSVHTEQRDGLIFTIHRAKRFEGGGVMIMSSVRGTDETLKKYPLKRHMLGPGRYVTDCPAINYAASPQGSGYFRLSLAEARHKGVEVDWWMMVPRGAKPDWFEDQDGRVQLKLGITPQGEYAKANHADEHGVIHHITWDLALDIPKPDAMPSLTEITGHVYSDLTVLSSVFSRYLYMGIRKVNNVPHQQSGSTDDVSPEEFAAATREHLLWWARSDIDFQLTNGGTTDHDEDDEYVMKPAVFLDYNSAVDDATLSRATERTDLVSLSVRGTHITDAGIAFLKGLNALTRLNIADTSVTDDGLRHLEEMASLQKLNVEGTGVTQAGIERLQQALPNLDINASDLHE